MKIFSFIVGAVLPATDNADSGGSSRIETGIIVDATRLSAFKCEDKATSNRKFTS